MTTYEVVVRSRLGLSGSYIVPDTVVEPGTRLLAHRPEGADFWGVAVYPSVSYTHRVPRWALENNAAVSTDPQLRRVDRDSVRRNLLGQRYVVTAGDLFFQTRVVALDSHLLCQTGLPETTFVSMTDFMDDFSTLIGNEPRTAAGGRNDADDADFDQAVDQIITVAGEFEACDHRGQVGTVEVGTELKFLCDGLHGMQWFGTRAGNVIIAERDYTGIANPNDSTSEELSNSAGSPMDVDQDPGRQEDVDMDADSEKPEEPGEPGEPEAPEAPEESEESEDGNGPPAPQALTYTMPELIDLRNNRSDWRDFNKIRKLFVTLQALGGVKKFPTGMGVSKLFETNNGAAFMPHTYRLNNNESNNFSLLRKSCYLISVLASCAAGAVVSNPRCSACEKQSNLDKRHFNECLTYPNLFDGACTNCNFSAHPKLCTLSSKYGT